ncbi:hypothetical protein SAMN04490243_2532 [Robiginitalea myxolifaciens]|uniref:Uncharacterized protein n=1 Tax=Robiginitalea myxolifaciens TaxID=400055 RepID=A0A1I6HC11_9FLAO|nr:hypothetical protein [Robiginitalea myxolifaciens]SFR51928.1 hypothetical protein SAMN04490243_2532 [Robiginitalea myxolifaciens]
MKKFLTNLWIWAVIGLTILGFVLLNFVLLGDGRKDVPDNIKPYFLGLGVLLVLPMVIVIVRNNRFIKNAERKETRRKEQLIRTGKKVPVNLDEVKIHTNSYLQEVEVGSGYARRNETVDVDHNVILLEIPYANEVINYRIDVGMDPERLRMHLAIKGETILYVDPNDPNNHYLDLKFLTE